MKRFYRCLIIIFFILNTNLLLAQWYFLNPTPQPNSLLSVYFTDVNTGYASGSLGTILKTTDGGNTWQTQSSGTNSTLNSIFFVDDNTGFAVGADGKTLKTVNGGIDWVEKPNSSSWLYSVFFVNNNTGFAVGESKTIKKTSDGGETWTSSNNGVVEGYTLTFNSVFFTDNQTGYAAGYSAFSSNGYLYKTTDGGANWTKIVYAFSKIYSIYFIDSNTGICVGTSGKIYKTTDGGTNWSEKDSQTTNSLISIKFTDQNNGFILSSNSVIKTTDGGDTWTEAYNGIGGNSMFFLNSNTGIIVGSSGQMYKSTNGGSSWTALSSLVSSENLTDIHFRNNTGVAVGNNSTILKTENGGVNWITQNISVSTNLFSVFLINSTTACAVGSVGRTFIYDNLNDEWNLRDTPIFDALLSVFFTNETTGYTVGENGTILKTTDQGLNWNIISSPTSENLNAVFFLNENIGFIAGNNGVILKTTDAGENWQSQNSNSSVNLYSICFSNNNNGFSAGDDQTILKTTDGGNTWSLSAENVNNFTDFRSIFFADAMNGYVGGSEYINGHFVGVVYSTEDGGLNWSYKNLNFSGFVNSISSSGNSTWYISGSNGVILKTTNGLLPVELTTFSANVNRKNVDLNWETATEVNNYGFEIEKQNSESSSKKSEWEKIGFIQGHGNSNSPKYYTFTDKNVNSGKYSYRLKQIDIDGKFEYSDIVEVDLGLPIEFSLSQNYPNPFNPSTTINYSIPIQAQVSVKVYDILGKEIVALVDKQQTAGNYNINFDASSLPSGIYFYKLQSGNFIETKKMLLMK